VELFGLSPQELFVIAIVAILVFGQKLPQVAGEAAATVQKIRRALHDLRRESGIDHELSRARREIEDNVVRPFREVDVAGAVRRETSEARSIVEGALSRSPANPLSPPRSATETPDVPKSGDERPATPPDPEAPPDPHRG